MSQAQVDAYSAVMKAMYAQGLTQEQDKLLTELRSTLGITDAQNHECLMAMSQDEEFKALRDAIKGQRASRGPSPAAPNSAPPAATGRAAAAASRRASAAAALAADGGVAKPKAGGGRDTKQRRAARANNMAKLISSDISFPVPSAPKRDVPAPKPEPVLAAAPSAAAAAAAPAAAKDEEEQVHDLIMHEIWRFWPDEGHRWIKGIITDYNREADELCIIYYMNTAHEEWEWVRLSNMVENEESANGYRLAGKADVRLVTPASEAATRRKGGTTGNRGGKRRRDLAPSIFVSDADAEASLQRQIAVAGVDELLRLAEGFKQRTAEANAEVNLLIELDAPWQDPDKLLQLQLEQLTAHEKALIAELSVTMPADSDILVN